MTNQVKPFNKALQLKFVLDRIRQTSSTAARHHLASIFSIDASCDELLQSRLKQTRKLVREVQRELKTVSDIDQSIYLSWVQKSLKMLSVPDLDYAWNLERHLLDSADMVRLEFCIDVLKRLCNENFIADEELADIRKATEDLKQDILDSNLDVVLKEALVDALQVLITAIDEYELRGVARLKEGLSVAIGTVIVNFGSLKKPSEANKWSKYSSQFGKVISGLWKMVSLAIKNKEELEQGWTIVKGLMGDGSAGESSPSTEN